jgi:hypothetical protein
MPQPLAAEIGSGAARCGKNEAKAVRQIMSVSMSSRS